MTQKLVNNAISFLVGFNFFPGGIYDNYGPSQKADLGKHWSIFDLESWGVPGLAKELKSI